MKKDAEVRIYMQERQKGTTQRIAAARAGISERSGRKYEQGAQLPSQIKQTHTWRTRENPFEEDWPWVVSQLERDDALQVTTLFALLCAHHPDRYRPIQVRTLQRHVAGWRALNGPDREVIFQQEHVPGERGQSDFTHMEDLAITIAGTAFPHLVFHFVLTYSNVEAVQVCFSESFESLAEGLEYCLWQIGGVPLQHRTDHLSAASRRLGANGREDFTQRYAGLMAHYAMTPTWNNLGGSHENGDVEQSHFRFKQAVDQALRVIGSRDFPDRTAYERFLNELVRQRNQTRQKRFELERQTLRPLPAAPLAPCRELRVNVTRFSTIHILSNTYSVPSRLIATSVLVRVRAQIIEGYVGTTLAFTLPRLIVQNRHQIDYRHIIWSLARKPGAFAAYRYREQLYPTTIFRQAYDRLQMGMSRRYEHEYVRILYLAATTSEVEVETALGLLLECRTLPTINAVRDLLTDNRPGAIPQIKAPVLDLSFYDELIPSRRSHA